MRGALLSAVILAAACYRPTIPSGVPCSTAGDCPGGEACVAGVCGGVEPGADAPGADAPADAPPGSTVVVVGADKSQLRDTEVWLVNPTTNYGAQDHFSVDLSETGLVWFDVVGALAAVPPGLGVAKATLRVVTTDHSSTDGGTVVLYRVLESWDESTATWKMRTADKAWTSEGATPPSRDTVPVAELRPNQNLTPFEVGIPVEVVNGWRADPATNFGLAFVRGTSTQHVHIATRETGLWSTLTLELRP
jgi:hypothetical protein